MADACWWCGREATILCDHVIGMERRKSDNAPILDQSYSCDAELCRACAKPISHIGRETVDACPEHAASFLGGHLRDMATSKEEADRVRRGIKVRALRSRMRVVSNV